MVSCAGNARTAPNSASVPAPLTTVDTITRLVLDTALMRCPGTDQESVLISARGGLNTLGLVRTVHTRLTWLSLDEIQRYADDHGDVAYWEVYPASVRGDSATVSVSQSSAFRRPNHQAPVVRDGGMYCDWIAVRREGVWVVVALGNIIVLRD
jgi:hypothetical protein